MKPSIVLFAILLAAAPATAGVVCNAQTGLCVTTRGAGENVTIDRRAGSGTVGNRNFEIDAESYGQASGHNGGRAISNQAARPGLTQGNVGATQSRCYADGNGNTYCR